ncbi:DUF421 domain-containing protein [Aquibacillus sediminis]|uniref:DUF421 domain-containing protein n=1 Tax=Aquibacillus sediminis TaxID=2574734 RepID=UPI001108A838|nr:DUF421 domain-containing protein [Aquibacillus sediminis]
MLETVKDCLLVMGRIATIIPLLLFVTLFMGKRAIGELPVFDFLIVLTIGAVVGADIADPNIKHIPTATTIVALGIFQRLMAKWKISNRKIGRLITFEPTIVVKDGKILNHNLKKIRYSIDNVLQMLRQKDVFDLNDVDIAIIEANGSISVYKKTEKNAITREDMAIRKQPSSIALPIIVEGKLYRDVMNDLAINETWLHQQLADKGIKNLNDVFFASINDQHQLHVSQKQTEGIYIPKLYH